MSIGVSGGYQNQNQTGNQSGTQSGTSTTTQSPYSGIQGLLDSVAGGVTGLGQTQTPYFPGQGYVGPSSATQAGVNMGMSSMPYYQAGAQTLNNAANQQAGAANTALGNYNFLSGAADVANNPYVQNMLGVNEQRVNQNFAENLLPQINSGSQSVNAMGSSRQGIAQAQGAERTAQQLANTNKEMMLGAYGQGLGAQQNALSSLPTLQSGFAAPGITQGLAGDMLQKGGTQAAGWGNLVEGYQGRALQDAISRFNYQYEEPWQRMGNVGNVISGIFGPYGTSTTDQTGNTAQNSRQNASGWQLGGGVGTK